MLRLFVPTSLLLVLSLSRCTTEPRAAVQCLPTENNDCSILPD